MNKLLLFLILMSQFLFPQLKEMEVKPTENRGQIPIFRDHPDKAALIFYTQFDNLSFYSSYGIIETTGDQKGGKYILIIEPTRQAIEVRCSGFKTEIIKLGDIQPRDVLYYEVLPKKDEGIQGVTELGITIQVSPQDVKILLDGKAFPNNTTTSVTPGSHQLHVEKSGFTSHFEEIFVSPQNTFFQLSLSAIEPIPVTISSIPPDAEIFIDGMSKGKTTRSMFIVPGKYDLRLVLPGYLQIAEQIVVSRDETKNKFAYQLKRNTGILKLVIDPPTAKVKLNKEFIDHRKEIEMAPGDYIVEVEAETYIAYRTSVEITLGQTTTKQISLERKTGKLQFTINPAETECTLSQNGIEKFRWTGLKLLNDIPVGTYEVTATFGEYNVYSGKVIILEDQTTIEDIQMVKESETPEGMVFVGGGTFIMGNNDGRFDEKPAHQVTVSSYYIGKTEVTLRSFEQFIKATNYETDADTGGGSDVFIGKEMDLKSGVNWRCDTKGNVRGNVEINHPVIHVSWKDAVAFCNWLSEKEGLQKAYTVNGNNINCDFNSNGYRLPTEAEWEFAARGGNKSRGYEYSGSNDLNEVAWYGAYSNDGTRTSDEGTSEVGKKQPNELGLYDMSGNVAEWCFDIKRKYSSESQIDPKGKSSGSSRVTRGGSLVSSLMGCRIINRFSSRNENHRGFSIGFRLAKTR